MKKIPYGRHHLDEDDIKAVNAVLTSDFLTQGPVVKDFENEFSRYVGSKYAVAVSNGTAALHLSAMALNIKPGSRIITTPLTFAATANCIEYCQGEVHFCDIDPKTWLIDPVKLQSMLEEKPNGYYSGVIVVDFSGRAVDVEIIKRLTDEHGCWLIEDASHAPGAYFIDSNGSKQLSGNGVYSDLTTFSFHPVKHIASGEGGMITTNNQELYEKLIKLRTHGIFKSGENPRWTYDMINLGFNYRLPDILAALGLNQTKKAGQNVERRRMLAKRYHESLRSIPDILSHAEYVDGHAYHLYVIIVNSRTALYDYLHSKGILVQIHYIPVYQLAFYKNKGWNAADFPVTESYYNGCISLPMYPSLTEEEQDYVISQIINFFEDEKNSNYSG